MRSLSSAVVAAFVVLLLARAPGTRADFGDALMYEAVDLKEAHTAEQEEEARSMESLLHWAIANSNPEELAKRADSARHEDAIRELTEQLEERRARVKELKGMMDAQVTETQLMKEALLVLVQPNASAAERLQALQDLQPLVEPIDNANDLKPLGGITPLVQHLFSRGAGAGGGPVGRWAPAASAAELAGLRSAAAFVIGSAASNNVRFQADLMEAHPDIFERLLELALDSVEEVGVKGMYALATMVRNLQPAQQAFAAAGGYGALEQLMLDGAASVRVKRKALALVMDLSQLSEERPGVASLHRLEAHQGLLSATLQLLGAEDLDMVEKALETLQALLQGAGRREAALNLQAAAAGAKLSALDAQLHEAQQQEPDMYQEYLLELCGKVEQLLETGAREEAPSRQTTAAPGAGPGAGSDGEGGAAADGGQAEGPQVVLQLGHSEM